MPSLEPVAGRRVLAQRRELALARRRARRADPQLAPTEVLDRRALGRHGCHAFERRLTPERARGDHASDLGSWFKPSSCQNDLMHRVDPYRFLGAKLLGGRRTVIHPHQRDRVLIGSA